MQHLDGENIMAEVRILDKKTKAKEDEKAFPSHVPVRGCRAHRPVLMEN